MIEGDFPEPGRISLGGDYNFKGFEAGVIIHCWIEGKKFSKWAGETIACIRHNVVLVYRRKIDI